MQSQSSQGTTRQVAPFGRGGLDPVNLLREIEHLVSSAFGIPSRMGVGGFGALSGGTIGSGGGAALLSGVGGAYVPIEVTENNENYQILAELPGLTDKDIDVSVVGNTLTIRGHKQQQQSQGGQNQNVHVTERSYGEFQRSFQLPEDVDRDQIKANFTRGVLSLQIPKTPDSQKQQKKIQVTSQGQ